MTQLLARLSARLTYANITATLALFVALGGTSYAALTLPRNSVGSSQIRKNAVGSSEIRRRAVGSSEISRGAPSAATTDLAGQATGRLPRTGTNPIGLLATGLSTLLGGLGLRRLRSRPASR